MRTFIAIDIPESIKKEIVKIQEQIPKFNGKKTEFENLHLTLKFLGEVSEDKLEEVKERLREVKFNSFKVEINSIGFFDNSRGGIIWINMTNCENLQKEIDYKLEGLFEKEKRFMGHLTIARVKYLENKKEFLGKLKTIKISPMEFRVESFNLKKSTLTEKGSIYKDIEIYKLKI